uniref:Nucleotide-diphospho-sugar transferase domain-containing protein n=2 Tax=Plectus sambesii TaxID=2011161 RepID=A0A914WST6_9BILA
MLEEFDKPPAILMLNQYAINMTHNFLCNTAQMRGVHERLVFVTVDKTAAEVLRKEWPHVKQFYWPTPCLYKRFNFAEPAYQLIYVLRANLAAILIRHGYSFWMMQQDTFWRANLFDLNLEYNSDYDMLFDQIGDSADSPRAELVNGANFFVRANNKSLEFFNAIANKLSHWYAPDMAIMIHQCYTWGHNRSKCEFMSQRIAQSWEWIYTEQKNPPYIMQLDCEVRTGSKLSHLARYGFSFTLSDGKTCNQSGVEMARHRMNTGAVDASKSQLSWGRIQFKAYYFIADWLFRCIPYVKPYLPLMGFCIMVTF